MEATTGKRCLTEDGGYLEMFEEPCCLTCTFMTCSHLMEWPRRIPADLEKALAELESFRFAVRSQDRWTMIREWLEKHEVPAPDALPQSAKIKSAD